MVLNGEPDFPSGHRKHRIWSSIVSLQICCSKSMRISGVHMFCLSQVNHLWNGHGTSVRVPFAGFLVLPIELNEGSFPCMWLSVKMWLSVRKYWSSCCIIFSVVGTSLGKIFQLLDKMLGLIIAVLKTTKFVCSWVLLNTKVISLQCQWPPG